MSAIPTMNGRLTAGATSFGSTCPGLTDPIRPTRSDPRLPSTSIDDTDMDIWLPAFPSISALSTTQPNWNRFFFPSSTDSEDDMNANGGSTDRDGVGEKVSVGGV